MVVAHDERQEVEPSGAKHPSAERTRSRRKKIMAVGLRMLGPVLLLVVLWRIEHPDRLWDAIRNAQPLPLALAALAVVAALHLKVVRWRALLARHGYRYSLARSYGAVLSSLYVGGITPGRVGDVLRIQYLRKDLGVRYAEGLAVTVMDRLCDLYVLVALVAVGMIHFASLLTAPLAYTTLAMSGVAVLAPLVLLVPGVAERLMGRLYAVMVGRDDDGLRAFVQALQGLLGRSLVYAVILTVGAFFVNYLQGWLIGASLGLRLSLLDIVAVLAIASLLSLLPISISGLGVRELFMALVFPALGMTEEQGVVFGLLVFVCFYLTVVAAGFVAWQVTPPPFTSDETREQAED
jgi:uncharacterized protein (TIRG00374 family)